MPKSTHSSRRAGTLRPLTYCSTSFVCARGPECACALTSSLNAPTSLSAYSMRRATIGSPAARNAASIRSMPWWPSASISTACSTMVPMTSFGRRERPMCRGSLWNLPRPSGKGERNGRSDRPMWPGCSLCHARNAPDFRNGRPATPGAATPGAATAGDTTAVAEAKACAAVYATSAATYDSSTPTWYSGPCKGQPMPSTPTACASALL
mmetsp:Transcript_7317/g.26161  ORF Transcript_7317/g.26161 Transcript_7317/m.26161 type:complete len:209 (+) Transcript_7317:285-911(+)